MKDVLTALTTEIFKPLMTVVLPGAVSISTAMIAIFLRYGRLREIAESHRVETAIVIGLITLIMGEIIEDLGSRVEYRLDKVLQQQKDNQGALKFPSFEAEWDKYLLFDCERGKEPVAIRYMRTLLLRMKFELGMMGGFLIAGVGLWFIDGIVLSQKLLLSALAAAVCTYFLWEAKESHELLASTRHLLFGRQRQNCDDVGIARAATSSD